MLIGNKYKVESDKENVTIYKRKVIKGNRKGSPSNRVGESYWVALGYFTTVKGALGFIVEHEIKGSGLEDFETVVEKVQELHDLIKGLDIVKD